MSSKVPPSCTITHLSVYQQLGTDHKKLKELGEVYSNYERKARLEPSKVYSYDIRASTFLDGQARRRLAFTNTHSDTGHVTSHATRSFAPIFLIMVAQPSTTFARMRKGLPILVHFTNFGYPV